MIDWKKVQRRRVIVTILELVILYAVRCGRWIFRNAIYCYIIFACIWTILYLVDEIFQKMGVA